VAAAEAEEAKLDVEAMEEECEYGRMNTPEEESLFLHSLQCLLSWDAADRPTAQEALEHPFFHAHHRKPSAATVQVYSQEHIDPRTTDAQVLRGEVHGDDAVRNDALVEVERGDRDEEDTAAAADAAYASWRQGALSFSSDGDGSSDAIAAEVGGDGDLVNTQQTHRVGEGASTDADVGSCAKEEELPEQEEKVCVKLDAFSAVRVGGDVDASAGTAVVGVEVEDSAGGDSITLGTLLTTSTTCSTTIVADLSLADEKQGPTAGRA